MIKTNPVHLKKKKMIKTNPQSKVHSASYINSSLVKLSYVPK